MTGMPWKSDDNCDRSKFSRLARLYKSHISHNDCEKIEFQEPSIHWRKQCDGPNLVKPEDTQMFQTD